MGRIEGRAALRFEKDRIINSFRGFIEKVSVFSSQIEAVIEGIRI